MMSCPILKSPYVILKWPTSHGWMPLMSRGSHAFIDVAPLQADSQESNTKAKENRMVI